ncbi:MAG: response regulator [Thermomicrobiales bacterium]|nr:response regulator [Thermomicrobiales bacterium]
MAEPSLVVVVDDDQTLAGLITEVLEYAGFDSLVFDDPEIAVGQISGIRPAVVLLDVCISWRERGWDAIVQLCDNPLTSSIPLVVCTADDGFLREHAADLVDRGIPCLPKPFEIDNLIDVVAGAAHWKSGDSALCERTL